MSEEVAVRIARVEDEIYRTNPENPGLSLRLDRAERVLSAMLKVGGAVGGLGLAWKVLDVLGEIMAKSAVGP